MTQVLISDRVKETTTTSGTGTLTLDGAATGYVTFASAFADFVLVPYVVVDDASGDWESGLGTYNTGTLARTVVLKSSNAGAAVAFGTGDKFVFCDTLSAYSPVGKNVSDQTSTPTSSANLSQGYAVGSTWGMTDQRVYLCVYSTTGTAQWRCIAGQHVELGPGGVGGYLTGSGSVSLACLYPMGTGIRNATIATAEVNVYNNAESAVLMAAYGGTMNAAAKYSVGFGNSPQGDAPFSLVHALKSGSRRAQRIEVGYGGTTFDATPTELLIDTARFPMGGSIVGAFAFRGLAVCKNQFDGPIKAWEIKGAATNLLGVCALLGTPTITELGSVGPEVAGVTLAVSADDTNNALIVTATGAPSWSLYWAVSLEILELN